MLGLFNRLKQMLLFAGCRDEAEFQEILPYVHRSNFKILLPMTICIMICLFVMVILSFLNIVMSSLCIVYAIFCGLLTLFLLVLLIYKKSIKSSFTMMYIFMFIMYALGITIGIFYNIKSQAVAFIVVALVIPLLLVDRPIRMQSLNFMAVMLFVYIDCNVKFGYSLQIDLVNVIFYPIIGMFISLYAVKIQTDSFVTTIQLKHISHTDILTGLKNRNYYEQKIDSYPSRCQKNIFCIYLDVNGLHEINNNINHLEGDKMLCFIAQQFKKEFGEEDTFRIGGDEYIAFVMDLEKLDIENKIAKLSSAVNAKSYRISLGLKMQEVPNIDMGHLVRGAEKEMYCAKAKYYLENKIDRRKNRS